MRNPRSALLLALLLGGSYHSVAAGAGPTVYWDGYGVASVVADKLEDGLYGLGYAQAREYAARMAESYKLARGRMAEIHGRASLLSDGMMRSIGLEDAALKFSESMPADEKALLQSFCDGANKYIAENRSKLPGWIEPFTVVDVLSMTQLANLAFPLQELQGQLGIGVGSNQFAISGKRTTTGHPILSLDPHLGIDGQNGIVWQEFGLYAGGVKFRGICIPGLPVGIGGHSDRIAWSVTNNNPSLYALYQVKTNPQNARQYSFHGEWRDFENRQVDLRYLDNGKLTTFKQVVKVTTWGPMIPLSPMAVKFTSVGDFSAIDQALAMMRARNVDQFREALKPCGLSMWNYVVADVDGNIAYQYNAHLPKRDESVNWRSPVDGSLPNTAWSSTLWTTDELPHAKNPASGLLVNANSAPWLTTLGDEIPKLWPAYVTTLGHTSRYDRLAELLTADRRVSPEEAMKIATDTLVPNAAAAAQRLGLYGDGKLDEVRVMQRWNGRADIESVGTALYLDWLLQRRSNAALAAGATSGVAWSADQTNAAEKDLIAAGAKLKADLGSVDVPWGKMLRMERGGKQIPAGGFANLGGVNAAVRPTTGAIQPGGWIRANFGSSTRMIVSLEPKGVRSWSVLPYGDTDNPLSPHYADQMGLYAAGKYKEDTFGADAVAKAAKESLHLDVKRL